MIRLADVSTYALFDRLDKLGYSVIYTLRRKNIQDFQRLDDYIKEYGIKNMPKFVFEELDKVKNHLAKINCDGKCPSIYYSKEYDGLDDDTVLKTDGVVLANKLLLFNPISKYDGFYTEMGNYSINDIKSLLGHCYVTGGIRKYGQNAFCNQVYFAGNSTVPKLIDAINMYYDQVVRQSMETELRGINLFNFQHDEKREIVDDIAGDLASYIVNNFQETIWGEYKDWQKHRFVSNIAFNGVVRERLIEIFTNYFTLRELKNDPIKTRKIERFIKK